MGIFSFDLGTKTGYAVENNGAVVSGVWDLKPSRFDSGGMRFVNFRKGINELLAGCGKPELVVYEEVRSHGKSGVDAAHVYGGLLATLQKWCIDNALDYEGVPVGSIKKFATGKGNAGKPEMIAAAEAWGFEVIDSNHADALCLLRMKMHELPPACGAVDKLFSTEAA